MLRRAPFSVVLLGLLPAAACGSDGDVGGSTDMVAAITESLDAIDEDGGIRFTASEAECVARAVVDDVGVERLTELGADQGNPLTRLDVTTDERASMFSAIQGCVDLDGQLTEFLSSDPTLTADQAACLAERYAASDLLPEALWSQEPDDDLNARIDEFFATAFEVCA